MNVMELDELIIQAKEICEKYEQEIKNEITTQKFVEYVKGE